MPATLVNIAQPQEAVTIATAAMAAVAKSAAATAATATAESVMTFMDDESVDADLDAQLRALLSFCFTKPSELVYAVRRFWKVSPTFRVVVRDGSGKLLGNVAVYDKIVTTADGDDIHVWGVGDVCVDVAARGRGLVKKMLTEVADRATEAGIDALCLFADVDAYRSSGYVYVGNPLRVTEPDCESVVADAPSFMVRRVNPDFVWPAADVVVDIHSGTF